MTSPDMPSGPAGRRPLVGHAGLALAVATFAIGTGEFALMAVLPDMARTLGVSVPVAGHVISAYALGVVVGAPLITIMGAGLSRRRLLLALQVLFIMGNAASVLAPGYRSLVYARFMTGLPHGAFYGVAALIMAAMADPARRGRAVAGVFVGLTVAHVVGVPLTTWGGQVLGWRAMYGVITLMGVVALGLLARNVPEMAAGPASSPLRELGVLKRGPLWFTLATGAIGFGGMFCIGSYMTGVLLTVTHVPAGVVPLAQSLWGVGMVAGNIAGSRLVDASPVRAIAVILAGSTLMSCLFALCAGNMVAILLVISLMGGIIGLLPALQARLMDVAADAQVLAAALNHSAVNIANAFGAWLGGAVIAAGYGMQSVGWAAACLSATGLAVFGLGILVQRSGLRRLPA
ncbi:Inner membrane transport protein ydhP [Gluconacetobacter sp. SXCC-1]|uniref:MFS transporter n=2 Tax=Komagataeibacter rhaeticus TaxID=215221 RepID=UPI00020809C2|nr:MFS transporter [Komagataeibacter rhaeticus]EGG76033.1 Inner membrane transport protein ydhP [Gluconacetobacter sp. SXCC-1]KDU94402.1 MFS transporter [Komagataeibacter rhaeticus AF1]GBQ18284.1 arabinose transmembrane efflux protein [Komagataeibacter rhaeticus DSM 16663]